MIEEFVVFLKTWGVYEKFMAYAVPYIWDELNPRLFANCFFAWEATEEGYDFWMNVNKKWNDYLDYWKDELQAEYGCEI